MANVNLNDPADNEPDFQIWRANAINTYANLEQSLAQTMSDLIGPDPTVGYTIFFQISNTRSRLRIIETLMRHRHQSTFDVFLHGQPGTKNKSGLFGILNNLDQRRNEVVHWHVLKDISLEVGEEEPVSTLVLAPPAFWTGQSSERRTVKDLEEFCAKATFASRILRMLSVYNSNAIMPSVSAREAWRATWREIFQRPCSYPPEDSHPLSPNYKAPQSPPPPSRA